FADLAIEAGAFDLVYAWHVIEHVVDLDAFVRKAARLLAPGGVLWVGTETWHNASEWLNRAAARVRGDAPPYATSPEHTFVFTVDSLTDVLERRGLEVVACEAYQPVWRERIATMRFSSPLSRGWFFAQHAANALFRTGPLLRAIARVRQ